MPLFKHLRVVTPILTLALLITNVLPAQAAPGDETIYYLLTDHLGSVDVVLDEDGEVVERRDYLPYGVGRVSETMSNTTETDYKFTGKELDGETDLYHYEARYYDPLIGRFASVDPLVLDEAQSSSTKLVDILDNPQLLNAYSYAANNPVNRVDPTGEESQKALITAAIASLAVTYQYAERAGNGMGFMFEVYVTEDYEQAMNYARAYDENSKDLGETVYFSAKKVANELVPFSGTALGALVEEDIFVESFSLEDAVLNSSVDDTSADIDMLLNNNNLQSDGNINDSLDNLGYNSYVKPEMDEDE